jgi:class 3 adenylate cyclase
LSPDARFVRRGDAHLAFQVFGHGPVRMLELAGFAQHLEQMWHFPIVAQVQERLGRLGQVALYDWRGYGMSDPLPPNGYPIEALGADALAVMDEAAFERAVLWGDTTGGAVAIWLAVHHPERVDRLVLDNAFACRRAHPGYDIGMTTDEVVELRARYQAIWGTGATIAMFGSSLVDDARIREDWARYERSAATPSSIAAAYDMSVELDVRDLLAKVAVPTLIVHSTTNEVLPVAHGRYLAERIRGARYLEVETDAALEWTDGDLFDEVAEFVTGSRVAARTERSLAVVLFTDIAGSTATAAAIGDRAWRDLLERFRDLVRSVLERFGAREVNTRGDDFFAIVAVPSVAVDVSRSIRTEAASLGIDVRTGLHLGEVEAQGDDYAGLAVHIGARIEALAQPGEILMSRTVRDALLGSGDAWTSRGEHHLKGVPGEWELFAIDPESR